MSDLTKVSRGLPDRVVPVKSSKGSVNYVLDLDQEHCCFFSKVKNELICERCKNGDERSPDPGCELAQQNGYVYGWSESNCQYEIIGKIRDENPGV